MWSPKGLTQKARGQGTRKGLAELHNMTIQKYNGMCSNTKWKGHGHLLGEAGGQIHSCTPCGGYASVVLFSIRTASFPWLCTPVWATIHLTLVAVQIMHVPVILFRSAFASCLPCTYHQNLSSLLPMEKLYGQDGMAKELLSPRSIMKQDHRALVMWESLEAAGTGTDSSSAKPDWNISRQSSNPN